MDEIDYTVMMTMDDSRDSVENENRISDHFRFSTTFDDLFDAMLDNAKCLKRKEDGAFFVPCDFKELAESDDLTYDGYVRRNAENVKYMTAIVADIDDGMTIEEAKERFADYSYIIYTSFNHMKGGVQKFRIVFEISEPVTSVAWSERTDAILEWLGGEEDVDATCLYRSRGFFLPSWNKSNAKHFDLDINEGKTVDVMSFKKKEIVPYSGTPSAMNDAERLELLEELQNACIGSYRTWWQMVQAMKSEGFDLNDVCYVSSGNYNHCSPTTGVKDDRICSQIYGQVSEQDGGMGKLITYIRDGGNPDFHKSKPKELKIEEMIAKLKKKTTYGVN